MIELDHAMNAKDLRNAMRELPPPVDDGTAAAPWMHHRAMIRQLVQTEGRTELFLQWAEIEHTMVVGDGLVFQHEFQEIRALRSQRYIKATRPVAFGGERKDTVAVSTNLTHQLYHLIQLERAFGIKVNDFKSIVEYGGGYGAMCVVANRLGFPGKYTIIDFPEMSLLQNYWLDNVGYEVMLPAIDKTPMPTKADIVIGCYSFSEMHPDHRDIWRELSPLYVLIASQDVFQDVDNRADYQRRIDVDREYVWTMTDHPVLPGHFYALGKRVVK